MSTEAGEICWIDLGTADVEASVTFYTALLGWTVSEPDLDGYRLARLHGRPVAGLGPAEDPGTPYWTVYLHTEEITAATAAAVRAGATVIAPPTPAGDAGIAAVIRDPAGGPLSLWQPLAHAGTPQTGGHGTFAGAALHNSRAAQHQAFLTAAFGAEPVDRAGGRNPDGYPSPWIVSFHVDDIRDATRRAITLGAAPAPGIPGTFTDPSGALFGLKAAAGQ